MTLDGRRSSSYRPWKAADAVFEAKGREGKTMKNKAQKWQMVCEKTSTRGLLRLTAFRINRNGFRNVLDILETEDPVKGANFLRRRNPELRYIHLDRRDLLPVRVRLVA